MVQQLNNKYIFFDRDGTLNIDTGYVSSVEDFILYDDVFQSLSLLSKKNFLFILTTNQSGINRGFLDFEKLNQIHKKLDELLSAKEIKFKDKFFCPHLPTQDCSCRKPEIGMFLKASEKHNIDLKNSIVIGDSEAFNNEFVIRLFNNFSEDDQEETICFDDDTKLDNWLNKNLFLKDLP